MLNYQFKEFDNVGISSEYNNFLDENNPELKK